MMTEKPELRVGAHVLVQLGSELVTDIEQAILECVKNAYDADSPTCRIEIDTRETGIRIERGAFGSLAPFNHSAENVTVSLFDGDGKAIENQVIEPETPVERHLSYTGRITIHDSGDGMTSDQLRGSWLVISGSVKRTEKGAPKSKTKKGRTPLGDKGLGRLGSMKLGDILMVESSISGSDPVASAQFRWEDCETAETVDQIPVYTKIEENKSSFKGTKVHIFGLKNLAEWRQPDRVLDITRSLAKLISPFEATSTFPVILSVDGADHSLASVTEEVLKRAIAEFTFEWGGDGVGMPRHLTATARFRKRLFTSTRSAKQKAAFDVAFKDDGGAAFLEFLPGYSRLKRYDSCVVDPDGSWYITLERKFSFSEMMFDTNRPLTDPGKFNGAFYFFHLDEMAAVDNAAAAGIGPDRPLIKSMAGISILRDGFRVRSQGDWLGIAQGMTSGSTYGMRVNNTIGYFSLTGEDNFHLTEKSDREGFVEDAAYQGFFSIAEKCRDFANDGLEDIRRALDEYVRRHAATKPDGSARTREGSLSIVEEDLKAASAAKAVALRALDEVKRAAVEIADVTLYEAAGQEGSAGVQKTIAFVNDAIRAVEAVQAELGPTSGDVAALDHVRQEFETGDEQAIAMLEAASVGLAARGLTHELRTHLTEIRQRVSAIQKGSVLADAEKAVLPHIRAIRASCAAMSSAAALIDPMLPRSRAVKETFGVGGFIREYVNNRLSGFERYKITPIISELSPDLYIRMNKPRLLQVVDNLVRNSVYWLRREDDITKPRMVEFKIERSGFSVSDSGPGIDPHFESNLFEIFVSAKPRSDTGQGLGLFIVKQLLGIDGCDISLSSERNKADRLYRFDIDLRSVLVGAN